ncbi:MAG TPA: biotin--[acetyl-CoA-carboxylase] ligase [Armatimonadota bacterium]|jgi:BirA family biotin operon repressor/biotin-[acetyl-CoA-carboxylase] ligase
MSDETGECWPSVDLRHFDSLPSTNDEAVRLARAGAPEGTAVWANEQASGRGRRGRRWVSPPGNLYLSVVARPALPLTLAGRIAVSCGLGIARSLGLRSKWPNDLYLAGRKVGGILVEARAGAGGMLDYAVVGVGINVLSRPDDAPGAQPAASLLEHGMERPLEGLARDVARAILIACRAAPAPEWREGWESVDLAAGPIRVLQDGGDWEGAGESLDEDGALLARVGGSLRRVTDGDVSVRPLRPGG